MVVPIFFILYAGMTKTYGNRFYVSLGLLVIEGIILAGNGMRCSPTVLAKASGRRGGCVGDTQAPRRYVNYTFSASSSLPRLVAPLNLLERML